MILIAGAGAMADAANAMRRIQRGIDRRADQSRRRANRRARHYDYEPERTEFPCAFLCSTCGYYVDAPAEEAQPGGCPSCGDSEWLDLALEPTAARVRDMETSERMRAPASIRYSVIGIVVGIFAAIAAYIINASLAEAGIWLGDEYFGPLVYTALAATVVIPLVVHYVPRMLSVWLLEGRERIPNRWHIPLPLPAPNQTPVDAHDGVEANAVGETLEAPISRRECIAYQLCVLFDTPGDARPPEWVLQEQRATGVRLGDDVELGPNELYLESPVELVRAPEEHAPTGEDADEEARERYAAVKKYLRQRGLFVTDGDFHFYEAIMTSGDQVDVAEFDGEIRVLRHSDAAPSGEVPELPQP